MIKINKAFTLVELIVVITILAILGTIAFISLQGYSKGARDSRRISDISNIKTSLELFILNTGFYPQPDIVGSGAVYYSGDLLWTQGTVGNNVATNLSRNLPNKPLDPLFDIEYTYSLASTNKEYQLLAIYEGEVSSNNIINTSFAANAYKIKVEGTFNEIFLKTPNYIIPVPSIITSEETPFDLETENEKIESMVITNGTNFPHLNIPNTTAQTGGLNINLTPYTGLINSKSSSGAMIAVINAIQDTYTGSILATKSEYKYILEKINDNDKIGFANKIFLDKSIPTVNTSSVDSYTKLLISGNENATWAPNNTFTDSSNLHTVIINGNNSLDSGMPGYGNSIFFPGSGSDYLEIANSDDWNFGDGDFTMEYYIKYINFSGYPVTLTFWGDNIVWWFEHWNGMAGMDFVFSYSIDGNNTKDKNFSVSSKIILNNWHHFALVRNGVNLSLFFDGQLINTYNIGSDNIINNSVNTLTIGGYKTTGNLPINGYMDEIRISKGIARYSTSSCITDTPWSCFDKPIEAYK